jgi:hypothetical protein
MAISATTPISAISDQAKSNIGSHGASRHTNGRNVT